YIPGPASRVFYLLQPEFGNRNDPQQYFLDGNVMEGRPQYAADNWANGGVDLKQDYLDKDRLTRQQAVAQIKFDQPFCEPFVKTESAEEAYKSVLADVGDNYPKYDAVDARAIHDVVTRSVSAHGSKSGMPGIIDSQADVGGWPQLKGGEAPIDSDHDGIPDAWETAHGLNPNDPSDGAKDSVGDGYTNLERY